MSLENAPDDVKLAVDIIELLESNQIAPEIVLSALEMVRQDYVNKLKNAENAIVKYAIASYLAVIVYGKFSVTVWKR
ncbi:Protein of uncharacterised function (DUF2496) [Kluyvera cryocrescens]|uniref:Protein of uncharacterized function (DUF2496) n=1 Tax=Kluyvera cryocrescens TaxID=580 RepID=A0A485CZP8_KLUCR|nr:Protein of uncharacterised function (DUF2496) [Kluyvera cryocrescens]